ELGVVLVPADAAAVAERRDDLRRRLHGRGHPLETAEDAGWAVLVGEGGRVRVGQGVAAGGRIVRDVPGRRLTGQPLPDVALAGAGLRGQLARRAGRIPLP